MRNDTCDTVLAAVIDAAQASLGSRLVCVAAIGSLAHGGFSAVSDIDVAVIADAPGDGAWLDALKTRAHEADAAAAARLSIFWGDRALREGRFPPLDRRDLIEHGVPLWGALPHGMPAPSLDESRAQLRDSSVPYWARHTVEFGAQAPSGEDKELVRCLLYPARLAYSWRTGSVTSNDAAVAELVDAAPPGVSLLPVTEALAFRHGRVPFAALLRFRDQLAAQYHATLTWLGIDVQLPPLPEAT